MRREDIIMPRGDGTGPMGMGVMSGRGTGYCGGWGMPGYANSAPGRGRGMGFGRGRRNRFCATGLPGRMQFDAAYGQPDPKWEKQVLKGQADALQAELDFIKKRLSEMETPQQP
jgi:hypothetical protein